MENMNNNNIKITLLALGCSKNLVDCENMSTELKNAGYNVINDVEQSDIVVINTCGFIESAKSESISADRGVIPLPSAEFSPFAITISIPYFFFMSYITDFTNLHPWLPTISPRKSIFFIEALR